MAEHELSKTRTNAVAQKIRQAGLDPLQFQWTRVLTAVTLIGAGREPLYVPALVHTPTGYAFAFDLDLNQNGSLHSIFRPGPEGPTYKTHSGSWEQVLSRVVEWLSYVKAEYEAPDLWAELESDQEIVGAPPQEEFDNSPFTEDEREQIGRQLDELRELVAQTHELQSTQLHDLATSMEYLKGATERLGRFDWKQALRSQLVSLILNSVIPQEALTMISHFLTRGLGFLFGSDDLPLELPGGPPDEV